MNRKYVNFISNDEHKYKNYITKLKKKEEKLFIKSHIKINKAVEWDENWWRLDKFKNITLLVRLNAVMVIERIGWDVDFHLGKKGTE